MGFEQKSREEELKVDTKQAILALVHLKDHGHIEREQIITQLNFIKIRIEELVSIVGEEDSDVVEVKGLFRRNFLAFPVEI
jgi:hypothetical protein